MKLKKQSFKHFKFLTHLCSWTLNILIIYLVVRDWHKDSIQKFQTNVTLKSPNDTQNSLVVFDTKRSKHIVF